MAVELRKLRYDALTDVYCSRNVCIIVCCFTLKMEALRWFEVSVTVGQSTWRSVLEDWVLVIVIKWKRTQWAGHVAGVGVTRSNIKVRDHFGDLGVDGRIILKWVLSLRVTQGLVGWGGKVKGLHVEKRWLKTFPVQWQWIGRACSVVTSDEEHFHVSGIPWPVRSPDLTVADTWKNASTGVAHTQYRSRNVIFGLKLLRKWRAAGPSFWQFWQFYSLTI